MFYTDIIFLYSSEGDEAPSLRHKRKGRKRRHGDQTTYNGEVKLPDKTPEKENTEHKSPPNTECSSTSTTTTVRPPNSLAFTEPSKVVVRNPSPGRSRRSGILFKKKQYQPVNPSPLVLFSSSTSETQTTDVDENSPLKLRLRIDKNGVKRDLASTTDQHSTSDENARRLLTRSKSAEMSGEYGITNGGTGDSPSRVSKRRLSSQTHKLRDSPRRRDVTTSLPTMNGLSSKLHSNDLIDVDDDCFLDENQTTEYSDGHVTRKRTYTSSSANSDNETTPSLTRRKSHKRGRQKSAKLSFRQEFADLEGLHDIKYGIYMISMEETHLLDPKNEPPELDMLTLVWAKCKGYPSYPALVSRVCD